MDKGNKIVKLQAVKNKKKGFFMLICRPRIYPCVLLSPF
jgi:hypothetical protein